MARAPAGAATTAVYLARASDPADARRKLVRLTVHGVDVLERSARIFDDLRAEWVGVLGADRVRDLESDLRAVTRGGPVRLDVPGWLGGGTPVDH